MPGEANRKHKDSLFRDLFGSAERKENALQLYNALAGTSYDNVDDLELTTLEDVIYMNVKNDISFVIGDEMVLFEHQSTHNPNMPLRGLEYFARLFTRHVERMDANKYGTALIKFPMPRYYVFYSGATKKPEREVFRLSDAFQGSLPEGAKPAVEVVCEVINVNAGYNQSVAEACPALAGYSFFISRVQEYNSYQEIGLTDAVSYAIEDCIREGYLESYLREKKAEVHDMILTEWDAEHQRELDRQEGFEAGREQGHEERLAQSVAQLREAGFTEAADLLEQNELIKA